MKNLPRVRSRSCHRIALTDCSLVVVSCVSPLLRRVGEDMARTPCVGCLVVVGIAIALFCIARLIVFLSALVEQELESSVEDEETGNSGKLWSTP